MQLDSVQSIVRNKKFPPILFLFGEEEFLLDEAYQSVLKAVEESGVSEFNIDVVDGEEISQEQLVQMASAFPMMSDMRLLTVKHFERVVGGKRGKNAENSLLAQYIKNPAPSTCMLIKLTEQRVIADELKGIAAAINNPKQRDKAEAKIAKLKFPYNLLIKHADWIEFPKLYDREIPSWIAKRVKLKEKEISPDACELIVAQVGASLRDIHNELEKILTFIQDKPRIGVSDVISVVGASRTYNVFELQKAMGERSLQKALDIVQNMLKTDKQELLIISMLTRYFIALWKLSEAARLSQNHFELAKAIGVTAFFIPEYLAALNRYKVSEIEQAFFALHEADKSIKSSSMDTIVLMQRTIISIIEPQEKAHSVLGAFA